MSTIRPYSNIVAVLVAAQLLQGSIVLVVDYPLDLNLFVPLLSAENLD